MLIATSWDDGLVSDRPLLDILERHGVRASFAISPGRHSLFKELNDYRDAKYGWIVPKRDLLMYQDHDICNHTQHHQDLQYASPSDIHRPIYDGKAMLESLYCRRIDGIVWPYGVYNNNCITAAKASQHAYGRGTNDEWPHHFNVTPVYNWKTFELHELLESKLRGVVLYGHTYELESSEQWEWLDRFYRDASADDRCQLVTLGEYAEKKRNARESKVQL
jgi:hypothetical protein